MIVTAASLPHYLLERGLASHSSIVDGDFRASNLSHRNRVFQVLRGPHPGYVVKQVKKWTPQTIETLEREARIYSLMRSEPQLASLRRFLPRCYAYDAENQVLVLELLPESPPETRDATRLSRTYAHSIGEALRQWHQEAGALANVLQDHHAYVAWPLSLHMQPEDSSDSPAHAELARLVKRDAGFGRALDALRDQWRPQTLIHGDMKWGNCLISTDADGAYAPRFIDWELAGWGDPLWDVAGILQEYLSAWARAGRSVDEVAPAMRAFWDAYGGDSTSLDRTIGYAAARMIQTAHEHLRNEDKMTGPAIRLLQAASNILASPDRVAALFIETA